MPEAIVAKVVVEIRPNDQDAACAHSLTVIRHQILRHRKIETAVACGPLRPDARWS
jgi:hypothetical protein